MSTAPGPFDPALRDYLRLILTQGVGPELGKRLIETFGDASQVFQASPMQLGEVSGVGVAVARRIRSAENQQRAEQVIQRCEDEGIRIAIPGDARFPRLLQEIPDAPNVLFSKGELTTADALAIAIVGTRGATYYGKSQAARFARVLASAGLTIVSGLARGIDVAAHEGALEAGGRTIAVMSSGVSEIYPPNHTPLAERIIGRGAVISEMPPDARPRRGMFPQRNRLISGLTLGTIVVEAAERSGALITARLAGEQGREVFAVPGAVTNLGSRGCHKLIRDGATLVESPEQVIDALGPLVEGVEVSPDKTIRNAAELQLNEQENAVLQAVGTEPTDINQVVLSSGLPVPRVLSTLSVLEMRHLVRRVTGQTVQRV